MIVYATNIHIGGGKVLLDELLQKRSFGSISTLFCDRRYAVPTLDYQLQIFRVNPDLISRMKAEISLKRLALLDTSESILCFGNLPPFFSLKNKTIVYIQNAFTVPGSILPKDSLRARLRSIYEKVWFFLFNKNASEFWVQTNAMKQLMLKNGFASKTYVKPIYPVFPAINKVETKYDFVMVTSANRHKRTEDFLRALLNLSRKKKHARALIISNGESKEMKTLLIELRDSSVLVDVKLNASRTLVFESFGASRTLVNTSEAESFCLPLYEAKHSKLKIISVDKPYAQEAAPSAKFFKCGDVEQLTKLLGEDLT